MKNRNKTIQNARDSLIRADVYCKIIKELFIFLGCKAFLNDLLENDIRKFISRQEKKLSSLLKEEASKK
ncbi:MAG: hypothetical protein NC408_08670 [Candidatus Gastranaerophilales bacterium]|nr:hypothetical protein [Candidatus Gastranaerophilales bacterium]MCM1073393.1 hypothetical protein [Bacteroides sp.]